jgi:hypothetical protein
MKKYITIHEKSRDIDVAYFESDFIPDITDVIYFRLKNGDEAVATVLGRYIVFNENGDVESVEIEIDDCIV